MKSVQDLSKDNLYEYHRDKSPSDKDESKNKAEYMLNPPAVAGCETKVLILNI